MTMTRIQPFDIGCEPSPSVPAETLLADGWKTYLLFWAVSKEVGESGFLSDFGVAVVNCQNCVSSKFGYPNDEGMQEHPMYAIGLADARSSVLEVVGSPWAQEVKEQMHASATRIWSGRGTDINSRPGFQLRHFIFTLKETCFECLASSLAVEKYCATFDDAIAYVIGRLNEH